MAYLPSQDFVSFLTWAGLVPAFLQSAQLAHATTVARSRTAVAAASVVSNSLIGFPSMSAIKGVVHARTAASVLKPETRDAVLQAIAKARTWIDDLVAHRVSSFEEIAECEGKVERHIRLLAPLAFVSPRIIAALIDGTAPGNLTVTGLAKALPVSWAEQERSIGLAGR